MLKYLRLIDVSDKDIPYILSVYNDSAISRFVSIDKENYFKYVTENPNVYLYKVYRDEILVALTQIEIWKNVLYMDIVVLPKYQRRGIGTRVIQDIQNEMFNFDFERIKISIDETNAASIRLFEKMGFVAISKNNELIDYVFIK